ncbi:MAG TPA: hypothetical protein VME22_13420, partial [Solirubrobacteraceae bacterium]|nr:hypothetical protein [Solirubrobacteraceae bacterium]
MADSTCNRHDPEPSGITAIAPPPRGKRARRGLARVAAAAVCIACGLLAPAIASAGTLNQASSQWAELGPLSYTSTPVLSQQSQQDTSAL